MKIGIGCLIFLSTLSLRRATNRFGAAPHCRRISIHALLAESDGLDVTIIGRTWDISIHALLAESDPVAVVGPIPDVAHFYPRSPCGERPGDAGISGPDQHFYPRSPCGERRQRADIKCKISHFYPRSPCGERPAKRMEPSSTCTFLSTLSLRRATAKVHKTVGHFCAYETNFMGIASSC